MIIQKELIIFIFTVKDIPEIDDILSDIDSEFFRQTGLYGLEIFEKDYKLIDDYIEIPCDCHRDEYMAKIFLKNGKVLKIDFEKEEE